MGFPINAMASGTMKRQTGHFIRVESTMNFIERESQKHILLRLSRNNGTSVSGTDKKRQI
jgi:hypothetical protein